MSDTNVLSPTPDDNPTITLSSGVELILQPLKARQFFKLLRVITHGAAPILPTLLDGASESTTEEWVQKFLAVVFMALPESDQEALEFIASMVKPAGLIEKKGPGAKKRKLTDDEEKINDQLWEAVEVELNNPEMEDLVTIIEAIVKNEAEDLKALGKRLKGMLEMARKTGQIPA